MARAGGPGRTALPIDGTRRRSGTDRPTDCWRVAAVRDGPPYRLMARVGGPGRTALPIDGAWSAVRDGPPYRLMARVGGPGRTALPIDGACRRSETDRPTVAVPDFARFPSQHLKA